MKIGSLVRFKVAGTWFIGVITSIVDNRIQIWWLDGASNQKFPYDWFYLPPLERQLRVGTMEILKEGE